MPSGTHCPALALFRHRLAPAPPHLLWELGRGARRAGRRVRLQEHFLLAGVAPHAERGQVHRQVVLSRLEGRMRRKEDTGLKGAAGKPQIFRNLRFCSPHLSQACQGLRLPSLFLLCRDCSHFTHTTAEAQRGGWSQGAAGAGV